MGGDVGIDGSVTVEPGGEVDLAGVADGDVVVAGADVFGGDTGDWYWEGWGWLKY